MRLPRSRDSQGCGRCLVQGGDRLLAGGIRQASLDHDHAHAAQALWTQLQLPWWRNRMAGCLERKDLAGRTAFDQCFDAEDAVAVELRDQAQP